LQVPALHRVLPQWVLVVLPCGHRRTETDPSKTNSRVPNPVRNAAEVVVDARLDVASLTAWYLLADPNRFDTIEVGYLDGVAAPFLDQQDGWTIDGVEYKVRIDAAAAPLEFRTMYKNGGGS
jgi:hypothetical protein